MGGVPRRRHFAIIAAGMIAESGRAGDGLVPCSCSRDDHPLMRAPAGLGGGLSNGSGQWGSCGMGCRSSDRLERARAGTVHLDLKIALHRSLQMPRSSIDTGVVCRS